MAGRYQGILHQEEHQQLAEDRTMNKAYIMEQCKKKLDSLEEEYDNLDMRTDITPHYKRTARWRIKRDYQILELIQYLAVGYTGKEIEDEDAIEAFDKLIDNK